MADPNSTIGLKFHKKISPRGPLSLWNIGHLDQVFQDHMDGALTFTSIDPGLGRSQASD